jgi:hypothetical protein
MTGYKGRFFAIWLNFPDNRTNKKGGLIKTAFSWIHKIILEI